MSCSHDLAAVSITALLGVRPRHGANAAILRQHGKAYHPRSLALGCQWHCFQPSIPNRVSRPLTRLDHKVSDRRILCQLRVVRIPLHNHLPEAFVDKPPLLDVFGKQVDCPEQWAPARVVVRHYFSGAAVVRKSAAQRYLSTNA